MKKLLKPTLLLPFLVLCCTLNAKEQNPPEKQYDFLIGQWQCTYQTFEKGKPKTAYPCTWSGRYTFDGNMVQDDFTMYREQQVVFSGTTLRTWVASKNRWDLAFLSAKGGHYPNFWGQWQGDHMQIFTQNSDAQGQFQSKIRFKDITAEGFVWDMHQSRDNGETWQIEAVITATRAK